MVLLLSLGCHILLDTEILSYILVLPWPSGSEIPPSQAEVSLSGYVSSEPSCVGFIGFILIPPLLFWILQNPVSRRGFALNAAQEHHCGLDQDDIEHVGFNITDSFQKSFAAYYS